MKFLATLKKITDWYPPHITPEPYDPHRAWRLYATVGDQRRAAAQLRKRWNYVSCYRDVNGYGIHFGHATYAAPAPKFKPCGSPTCRTCTISAVDKRQEDLA